VCTVGDELIFGERESNGNERFLLRALHERGTPALMAAQLPDDPAAIASFVQYAKTKQWAPIFVAGGLGGTHDDMTREAVALALGRPLTRHEECFDTLTEMFRKRGTKFTPQRQRMAMLPEGCALIENPVGAPGFSIDGVFAFPGFPSMLHPMFATVLAQLDAAGRGGSGGLRTEQVELATSEGTIADIVEAWAFAYPALKVGIYPSNAHLNQKCKLVLRFRSGGPEDLAEETVAEAWAALIAQCEAKAAEHRGTSHPPAPPPPLLPATAAADRQHQPPRKVNQTQFGRKGDALQACFASLLDLPLAAVPNFIAQPDYMLAIQAFLAPRNLGFLKVDLRENGHSEGHRVIPFKLDGALCVVVGTSPVGGIRQCCVGVAKLLTAADRAAAEAEGRAAVECVVEVVHDPHPETHGFVEGEPLVWAGFLVALDPSRSAPLVSKL
jgi:molybdopterin-biosynthesis enzyme MoeA-like protein